MAELLTSITILMSVGAYLATGAAAALATLLWIALTKVAASGWEVNNGGR
jgi:hypothetical protein